MAVVDERANREVVIEAIIQAEHHGTRGVILMGEVLIIVIEVGEDDLAGDEGAPAISRFRVGGRHLFDVGHLFGIPHRFGITETIAICEAPRDWPGSLTLSWLGSKPVKPSRKLAR